LTSLGDLAGRTQNNQNTSEAAPHSFLRKNCDIQSNPSDTTTLFLLKHDYVFLSTQTIIRQPLQNFQNNAKYSAIEFKIRDRLCLTIVVII